MIQEGQIYNVGNRKIRIITIYKNRVLYYYTDTKKEFCLDMENMEKLLFFNLLQRYFYKNFIPGNDSRIELLNKTPTFSLILKIRDKVLLDISETVRKDDMSNKTAQHIGQNWALKCCYLLGTRTPKRNYEMAH